MLLMSMAGIVVSLAHGGGLSHDGVESHEFGGLASQGVSKGFVMQFDR